MSIKVDASVLKEIKKRDLRYFSDDIKGIKRKKIGEKFYYYDPNGVKISNQNILNRIKGLIIPPAWKEVWIAPFQNSHLQVTGIDSKNRKQYLYHPDWTTLCQEHKFEHLLSFCEVLPIIRNQVKNHLKLSALEQRKIIATVVWLLEHTFIRIGNDEYATENGSFGLTTLRNKHVSIKGKKVRFNFTGKSHVHHDVEIIHPIIIKTIKSCLDIPGYELFQYIDDDQKRHPVDSGEVNDYLQSLTGKDVTAKDFRTWGATLLSADTLCKLGMYTDDKSLEMNLKQTVKEVSNHLRNTPSVCRNYYIHPTIFDTYKKKTLIPFIKDATRDKQHKPKELSVFEFTVIELLKQKP